jgi:hypothetical protein
LLAPAAVKIDPTTTVFPRTRLWELGTSLHCSIIGTCLTTGELRGLVRKFGTARHENPTDHDLHGIAVAAAGRHDLLAKQIQKTLDQSHKQAINRFAGARTEDELQRLWQDAMQTGAVPGGYWALLTHPLATGALAKRVFGDVHMLSHLVGASNRADIRRLHRLEEEKAALEEKHARQQDVVRDGIASRDARIRKLNDLLSARIERQSASANESDRSSALERLVSDLRKQLDLEKRLRARAEQRASALTEARTASERLRATMEKELAALRSELETVEARLAVPADEAEAPAAREWTLTGRTILYVGGRTHHIARLRSVVEDAEGQFIHHDGGIEERPDLLAGLVNRADVAVFPIDCVSHAAAQQLKRLCRQYSRPFLPLRSSGIATLLHALRANNLTAPIEPIA